MAALLELHDKPDEFIKKLNNVGIPGVVVSAEKSVKCGITGTYINVKINGKEEGTEHDHRHHEHEHEHEHEHDHCHEHEHHEHDHHDHHHEHKHHEHDHHDHHREHNHNTYHDIEHRIGHLNISETTKKNVLAVYKLIADAESKVHGVEVKQIHFHEVGEMDAVADIVGVCMLIEELAPENILASAINTGSGSIRCSHGVLPVPAPAAALILKNIPIYSDQIEGELCTPTGAALLKHFVKEFCTIPVLSVSKIGYGMGKKHFEKANCVRAFIGDTVPYGKNSGTENEEAVELICNIDDMTPEAVAFAQKLLLDEGALDVWTVPIGMKKSRAGFCFYCLCSNEMKEKMVSLIFKHTSTLGIRENVCRRYTLHRTEKEVQTKFGAVRIKTADGFGVRKTKPEYEDVAKIAKENGLTIEKVLREICQQ